MKKSVSVLLFLLPFVCLNAQQLTPVQLIERSIAFHDPTNAWPTFSATFAIDGGDRGVDTVLIDIPGERFASYDGKSLYVLSKTGCELKYQDRKTKELVELNSTEPTSDDCARARWRRNYETYLNGLPMKLLDPNTPLREDVREVEFRGTVYWTATVDYLKPDNTTETWDFFFEIGSCQLKACRFYRSTNPTGGEDIVFEDTVDVGGVTHMIKKRFWYARKDDSFLGTDTILGEIR